MFGGIGFLLHGDLLVGVWKEALVVRLGEEEGEVALKEPHVKEFDIAGRPMRNWVLVGPMPSSMQGRSSPIPTSWSGFGSTPR